MFPHHRHREDNGSPKAHTFSITNHNGHVSDMKAFRSPRSAGRSSFSSENFYRGHRRTLSNTSNASRYSFSSVDHYHPHTFSDRSSTPTNFHHQLSSATSSRSMVSPATEEDFKEIIVLAETAKNETLICPLCKGVFRDPHIAACGHSFCRPCLQGKSDLCPLDHNTLSMVVKNLAIADQVGELLIHCRYGSKPREDKAEEYVVDPEGCPMLIKLGCREDHEKECEYAPIRCPNSSKCPVVMKKNLDGHLLVCTHVRCPHHRYHCTFEGTKEELRTHLEQCKFEGLKGFLSRTDEHIAELQEEVKRKDEEIVFLRSMLASLSEKVDQLEKTAIGRIDEMEQRQNKVQREVVEARHGVNFILNEVQNVQMQLGVAGTMDTHHLFKCKGTFVGHAGPVWALCVAGDMLFSASSDNTIKVWDTTSFKCTNTLAGHDGIVLALCALGEKYLFSGSVDHNIKMWSIQNTEVVSTIGAHDNPVCTITLAENRLYSGSLKSIKIWDIETKKLVQELPTQNHWVRALVVSGKNLYSGSYQAIKIWDLESLECIQVLQCHGGGSVYSLAVTKEHIICGTYENKICVWDVKSLKNVADLTGHVGIVYALQVMESPGSTRLFSACYDKTLRVWNMQHMTCAQTLVRHESSVTCLAISRGRLFSGSVDSSIKVWQ